MMDTPLCKKSTSEKQIKVYTYRLSTRILVYCEAFHKINTSSLSYSFQPTSHPQNSENERHDPEHIGMCPPYAHTP